MARRGDILRLRQRLGFEPRGEAEAVVVVQADPLNTSLATLLVVPLDPAVETFAEHPYAIPIPGAECGSSIDHVALTTQLRAAPVDSFATGIVGHLSPRSQAAVDRALLLVLSLG